MFNGIYSFPGLGRCGSGYYEKQIRLAYFFKTGAILPKKMYARRFSPFTRTNPTGWR